MTMHVMTIYKMDFSLISNSRIVSWNTSVSEGKGQATTINLSLLIICHSGFQFALSSDLGGGGDYCMDCIKSRAERGRAGRSGYLISWFFSQWGGLGLAGSLHWVSVTASPKADISTGLSPSRFEYASSPPLFRMEVVIASLLFNSYSF